MKLAVYGLLFDQQKWIMRYLENVYPHVDRIYLAYSNLPWDYNPNARDTYKNELDLSKVINSPYMDKITIIEGEWELESDKRNDCFNRAKEDGMDYLLAQDIDEFFFHKDYDFIKKTLKENPDHDTYWIARHDFWKSFKYTLKVPGISHGGHAQRILNVKQYTGYNKDVNEGIYYKYYFPDNFLFFHGSYVLSDEECYKKIKTWAHYKDFDTDKWYNEVWLPWTLESRNLHPIWPNIWERAEEFTDELPEVLKDFK